MEKARAFLLQVNELGLPVATEALDPIAPQYLGDLISWTAIGARTSESQTHREMASGLSTPVGFKNGTDGNIEVAINAIKSALRPHSFLGINAQGRSVVVRTRGNSHGHLVLRGGGGRANYDTLSISVTEKALINANFVPNIVVDCSHANSFKDPYLQPLVMSDCVHQIREGDRSIVGLMIESNIEGGNRLGVPEDLSKRRLRLLRDQTRASIGRPPRRCSARRRILSRPCCRDEESSHPESRLESSEEVAT